MKDKSRHETKTDQELATLAAARLDGDPVPTRVLIVPWGQVESTSGDFLVDAESARLVVEAFQEHGTDLPIDYEHQTLGGRYTAPTGQAPAAGWIRQIEAEEEVGVLAQVAWTEPALEQLAARQYRYLSPVALIRRSDRKLVGLHSVALTNKPAIVNMKPIVNRADDDRKGCAPKEQSTRRLPKEWDTPSRDDSTMTPAAALTALREQLSLPPDCAAVAVLAAAGRRLDEVARESAAREAQRRVTEAQRQGRLTEAQRAWALSLAHTDAALFDEWLKSAPVVVPLGRSAPTAEVDRSASRRKRSAESARAEFRSCEALSGITSEEAYVSAALRELN